MSGTREYEALVERLRYELMKADEDLRQATTPEIKEQVLTRYAEVLARFSETVMRKPVAPA